MENENLSAQDSQPKPGGNTRPPGSYQRYRWFFTLKCETKEQVAKKASIANIERLHKLLKEISKEFYFQVEMGKDGYVHYQGCFSLAKKETMRGVKNHFPSVIHLEGVEDWFASVNYCTKPESRVQGPWNKDSIFISTIQEENFYKWQKFVVHLIDNDKQDRVLHWIYDEEGCRGKTSLAKWLYVYREACILQSACTADIARAVDENKKLFVFNSPRSNEQYFNYGALESIKDGMIFSSKYESGIKIFDSPCVVVFTNYPPDTSKLSKDRWNIINLAEI